MRYQHVDVLASTIFQGSNLPIEDPGNIWSKMAELGKVKPDILGSFIEVD